MTSPSLNLTMRMGGLRSRTVLADVETINAKVDGNIERDRSVARHIESLALHAEVLMRCEDAPEELTGPRAARVARSLRPLAEAVVRMKPRYESFIAEHRVLVEPAAIEQVNAFIEWVGMRMNHLRSVVTRFKADYARDIAENADDLQRVAQMWSVLDQPIAP